MDLKVSVVVSTYNRSKTLVRCLDALLHQADVERDYEIVVVDNNSTDDTQSILKRIVSENPTRLRSVFEPRQGVSYGRNAGIAKAKAQIIAFTDDDVFVANDWIAQIKAGFAAEESIEYIGGKVLPEWPRVPPYWLTSVHWAPLGLVDYGDAPFYIDADRQLCLVSANFAFRRRALEQVGIFNTELQRVKAGVGSLEDHELLLRMWRQNLKGLYWPGLVVTAEIQPERLEKAYHRRWHTGHGHFHAVLRSEQMERSRFRLLGVPAHLYRQALGNAVRWLFDTLRRHAKDAFEHEIRLRFFAGFVKRRWKRNLV